MKRIVVIMFFGLLYAQDNGPIGRYYYAPHRYNDWMTEKQCSEAKGEICWNSRCAGSRQVNEYCCCNIVYDLVPDIIPDTELLRAAGKPDVIEQQDKAAEEAS